MVERQVVARGISHEAVLQAMRDVPREAFIAADLAEFAYVDAPLPIAEGQTISQPYIVALMAEALELKPGDRVLEVGAGSGYAVAEPARGSRAAMIGSSRVQAPRPRGSGHSALGQFGLAD